MLRVITYIDGFNLYFGLKSQGWERFLWLDVQALSRNLLKPDQTLADTSIYFGKYQTNPHTCRNCGHVHNANSEKMTDVNIAVELLQDAFQDAFDAAVLISADSDLIAPIEAVKKLFPNKRVIVACPPGRFSQAPLQVGACVPEDRSRLHREEPVSGGGAHSFRLHSPPAGIVEVTYSIC
jgi:hypothetical protein